MYNKTFGILILSILFSCFSCEKDENSENPFLGTWNASIHEELRLETTYSDDYSWISKCIHELLFDTLICSGIYFFDNNTLTEINSDNDVSIDTVVSSYEFINSNEFHLDYIGPIKIGVPARRYIRLRY